MAANANHSVQSRNASSSVIWEESSDFRLDENSIVFSPLIGRNDAVEPLICATPLQDRLAQVALVGPGLVTFQSALDLVASHFNTSPASQAMTLLVTCVKSPEDWEKARAIRVQVFIHEQHFEEEGEFDADDDHPSALHFIGKDMEQDKVVAAARVLVDDVKRKAKISRVAVLPECRGKRYGVALMNAIEDYIRNRVDLFILGALIEKKGFYEKCGYRCINDEIFVDEGAKQCWMTKQAHPLAEQQSM